MLSTGHRVRCKLVAGALDGRLFFLQSNVSTASAVCFYLEKGARNRGGRICQLQPCFLRHHSPLQQLLTVSLQLKPGMTYYSHPYKDLVLLWSESWDWGPSPLFSMNEPLILPSGLGFLKILSIVLNFGWNVPKECSVLPQKSKGFLCLTCVGCPDLHPQNTAHLASKVPLGNLRSKME